MWNFTSIGPKTKKLWLLKIPARRPSEQPGLGPPQKGVNCNFSSPQFNKPSALESSRSRTLKYAVQQDWPKDKRNYSSFNFLAENIEKFCSTELYGAPLEGSTIFLYCSSTCRMSMESYRLAELKYAIFSRTGRKTKKLRRSDLFPLTIFKHGLLEWSTILLQYSSINRTKLESSLLGELKCAISAAWNVKKGFR